MLDKNAQSRLRDHYARRTRSLLEAARAAHEIATAENLPIQTAVLGDAEHWHRQTLFKTVPVYGIRGRRSERVPAGAHLDAEAQNARLANAGPAAAGETAWSELKIKGEDFRRYMAWLHSMW